MNCLNNNCCDGIYNSFDVHFTGSCDNRCAHCIDMRFAGGPEGRPDTKKVSRTLIKNHEGYDDVLFLGGEPCLYLDELIEVIRHIQTCTNLKVFVTTAVPKICHDERMKFLKLIKMVDGMNLSVQHHVESVADTIRRTESQYDRQEFYASLPYKEKLRININIVKPFLSTAADITTCVHHYDQMGFSHIKMSEIQHGADQYVSFEKLFNLKMKSPFAHGCQTYLNTEEVFPGCNAEVLLKRSCFVCEDTLDASFLDGVKAVSKLFTKPRNNYAVVYGDGSLSKGWK